MVLWLNVLVGCFFPVVIQRQCAAREAGRGWEEQGKQCDCDDSQGTGKPVISRLGVVVGHGRGAELGNLGLEGRGRMWRGVLFGG